MLRIRNPGQLPLTGVSASRLFSDISRNSTVRIKDMPVHKITGIRSREYRRVLQILRRSPAVCRCPGNDKLIKGMPAAVRRPDIHSSICPPRAVLCSGEFARAALPGIY